MDSSTSSLSAVVPTRNTRELTLVCLESLSREAAGQVVLVDDAGTDGTAEAAASRRLADRVIRLDRPAGFTAAANAGLRAATGDLLLLLNSDTEVPPGGLRSLLAAFAADPRLGVAGAALTYPDGTPQWSGGRAPTLAWLFAEASGLARLLARLPLYRRLRPVSGAAGAAGDEVEWVTGAAIAFRRQVWEAIGPLDERFAFYGQDLDFCLRARREGWRVAVVPAFRVLHHHGATIGKGPGTVGSRADPGLLWGDLLRWAGKHRGGGWQRRARRAIAAGGRLRITGRTMVTPWLGGRRRAAWRRDTALLKAALDGLHGMRGASP